MPDGRGRSCHGADRANVLLPKGRIWQRWTFNAPLIQVVKYPGAQREGVTR
jgi:hypothetical protein